MISSPGTPNAGRWWKMLSRAESKELRRFAFWRGRRPRKAGRKCAGCDGGCGGCGGGCGGCGGGCTTVCGSCVGCVP